MRGVYTSLVQLGYPAKTNTFVVNQIIRYNEDSAITNIFFGTVTLRYSGEPLYMQMVMNSDETQIQIFANWPMPHAKRVTGDNRKNPEYRVVVAIRKMRTDANCPAGKSWPNHVLRQW